MEKILFMLIFFLLKGNCAAQNTLPISDHEQWEYALESTGDVLQFGIPLSAGLITIIKEDYEGTKKLAFSYGASTILTHSLKYLIDKKRPEGSHRYDSFPSGHTASAFTGASFVQRRYGWKYGVPAYLLAGIVAVSRMEGRDGYHDIIDVIGGIAVGVGSTYLFTKPYEKNRNVNLGFQSNGKNYLLSFNYVF